MDEVWNICWRFVRQNVIWFCYQNTISMDTLSLCITVHVASICGYLSHFCIQKCISSTHLKNHFILVWAKLKKWCMVLISLSWNLSHIYKCIYIYNIYTYTVYWNCYSLWLVLSHHIEVFLKRMWQHIKYKNSTKNMFKCCFICENIFQHVYP